MSCLILEIQGIWKSRKSLISWKIKSDFKNKSQRKITNYLSKLIMRPSNNMKKHTKLCSINANHYKNLLVLQILPTKLKENKCLTTFFVRTKARLKLREKRRKEGENINRK